MIFYYTHRSVPFSAVIRETSSLCRWKQSQLPKVRHYAESERPWWISLGDLCWSETFCIETHYSVISVLG